MMEYPQIDLYEFLSESELQHYYNAIKKELKITNVAQFKYATDEDLRSIGMARPEIRRLRKFYEKYFPHGYLSKFKRLLQAPTAIVKRDDVNNSGSGGGGGAFSLSSSAKTQSTETLNSAKMTNSPSKVPNNKHIIPADSISVNKQLGTGEFGIVQQGVWTNGTERIQVAIKCLCRERMQSNPMEFLKEAAIMHSIEHENIVRLYGVVLATDSLMLVTELAHLRSLLECLKDSGLRISFLTIPTLCEFAMQICNGMSYLEQKRLIHRDLAARNILVFSKNKVKISDFGLSRALGVGKDYYKTNFNVNLKLPIAWCAPECINYLRFTNASDVWAFGVCLWEMFSYGFQPWAALTGLQILEAIDSPNFQRLEQPDCCPTEYYTLMAKCWQDDPAKRPKFSEIYEFLPDMKPEQLKTVMNCLEPKKDHLVYRQGEIITVLDRNTGTPFWKGVLNSGKTGYFNPSNTVAFLEGLPSSNRDSFCRASERSSKRKLRTEMISKPQNDFKHTGHVGIDGASFGDVAFLSSSQSYNHVPRQIVTPYKPSEDIEQTPLLLPPTPTSPDSFQTASAYFPDGGSGSTTQSLNPTFISSAENTPKKFSNTSQSSFEFPTHPRESNMLPPHINSLTNPFADGDVADASSFALANNNYGIDGKGFHNNGTMLVKPPRSIDAGMWRTSPHIGSNSSAIEDPHEYHEISDDEITADKLDFGPSLLDEINSMFGSMHAGNSGNTITSTTAICSKSKSPIDFDSTTNNAKHEFAEMSAKLVLGDTNGNKFGSSTGATSSSSSHKQKKTGGTMKPISLKDERIINQAIEIANEISAKSMIDLVSDQPVSAQSPKRKFSFRFPHLNGSCDKSGLSGVSGGGNAGGSGGSGTGSLSQFKIGSPSSKKKNFTEELESIPDIQEMIGDEGREAYNSLIERKGGGGLADGISPAATLLRHLDTNEFSEIKGVRTLPRRSVHESLMTKLQKHILLASQHQFQHQQQQQSMVIAPVEVPTASVPVQHAPRPMTLPTRNSITAQMRKATADILKSGDAASSATDEGKENSSNSQHHVINGNDQQLSPCESPSYLTHTFYKFPMDNGNGSTPVSPTTECKMMPIENGGSDSNPIPLPPRDGKKHIKTNAKRHVRRYPLIIPGSGVQRTLNKVTDATPTGDEQHEMGCNQMGGIKSRGSPSMEMRTVEMVASVLPDAVRNSLQDVQAQLREREAAATASAHTYQNLEELANNGSSGMSNKLEINDDTASLQFESILESSQGHTLQSPDVTDGFYNFSIQKEHYHKDKDVSGLLLDSSKMSGLYVNEDELRNLDIEGTSMKMAAAAAAAGSPATSLSDISKSASDVSSKEHSAVRKGNHSADNELAANALFNRVRQSVDSAMGNHHHRTPSPATPPITSHHQSRPSSSVDTVEQSMTTSLSRRPLTEAEYFAATAARLASSNSVSCEDLLEFADKKPKGCERGVDSDEVRIMMKVLGKDTTPNRCLHVLEFIDWDVHKAIKIIRLQNILSTMELSLRDSVEVLEDNEWDLHTTALKMKGLKA